MPVVARVTRALPTQPFAADTAATTEDGSAAGQHSRIWALSSLIAILSGAQRNRRISNLLFRRKGPRDL